MSTKRDRQYDFFNAELVKLIKDSKNFIIDGGDIYEAMADLEQDIRRAYENSQTVN